MGFNLDFNDVYEGSGRIADGDYEVVVKNVKEDATPGGAEYVEFDLVLRNDFNQEHKNMHVFHKVWKAKATGKYNMKQFNTMGKAFQLQNGKTYTSFQDLLNDFILKTARISLKNEKSEHNGKEYTNYNVFFNPTALKGLNHTWEKKEAAGAGATPTDPFINGSGPIEIKDDDLPF